MNPELYSILVGQPLAMSEAGLRELLQAAHAAGDRVGAPAKVSRMKVSSTGVALIPVHGLVAFRPSPILSFLGQFMGGVTDLETLAADVQEAQGNPDVTKLLFDISSSGGFTTGLPETASLIAGIRKPKIAWTDTRALSAAYWLASSCDAIYCAPSAEVGSVGVVSAVNTAGAETVEVFRSGELKAPGTGALSDPQRSYMQGQVNAMFKRFLSHVEARRGAMPESVRSGGSYFGFQGRELKLVDQTFDSFDEFLRGSPAPTQGNVMAQNSQDPKLVWQQDASIRADFSTPEVFATYVKAVLAGRAHDPVIARRFRGVAVEEMPASTFKGTAQENIAPDTSGFRAEWDTSPDVREEFNSNFAAFVAFKAADAQKRILIHTKG